MSATSPCVGAGRAQQPGRGVLEQELDRLGRVLLVRADHAARAALDPAGAVHARDRHAGVVEHAAAVVPDRRAALVERDARHRRAPVADAPQHEPARDHLALVGRHGADPPARVRDELVPHDLDRLDPAVAEDRDRGDAEAKDAPSSACPSAASPATSRSRSTLRRAIAVSSSSAASLAGSSSRSAGSTTRSAPASSVSSCSSGVVNAACAGPAPAEHEDLADPGAEDRGDRLVRRVGRLDLLGREREHPRHVDGDVPVADDDGALARRGRTGSPGSRGGRCTRRRTRSRATSRGGPRRESPSAGRPARRRRRRRRRRAPSARRARGRGPPRRCRRSGSPGAARSSRTRARRT